MARAALVWVLRPGTMLHLICLKIHPLRGAAGTKGTFVLSPPLVVFGAFRMPLTPLEYEFLKRLSGEPRVSPPLLDHSLVARLAEAGHVETEALPSGEVRYQITNLGKVALESA